MDCRRIDAGGVGLQVLEAGRGGRPLLLLHGFAGAKEDFAWWLELLGVLGWHAVAPDHRGHGASDKPAAETDYSFAILAADALALADAFGWPRFTLLGHSMGGMVAQRVVLEAPERVGALVLMDTSHGPLEGVPPEDAALARQIVRESGMEVFVELERERGGAIDTAAHRRLEAAWPGYGDWGAAKKVACSPAAWLGLVDEVLGAEDRLEHLGAIGVPTLVLVGEQDDKFVGPGERMAKTIPDARLVVVPDAGHSPQFENPDVWWAALTGFLQEVAE